MRKAINQWGFPSWWTWEEVFSACRDAGFAALEICVDYLPFFEAVKNDSGEIAAIAASVGAQLSPSKALTFDSSDDEIRHVANLAQRYGIAVSSALAMAQFSYPLTSGDDEIFSTGIDLIRRLFHIAELLGAPNLLVLPGYVSPTVTYEDALARLTEAITALLPEAHRSGVGIGLENVWSKFLYSPIEFRDFVDSFDDPLVGVHFDVGNVMQLGYPDQWIRVMGERIRSIHLKDYRTEINNIHGFTHLFHGDVPWDSVMSALRHVGYEGYLIAEVPPYRFLPEVGIQDTARKIDLLLGMPT